MTMFMVLSSWQSHCESSPGSFDECRMAPSGRRPETKPDDLGFKSACIQAARIYTHHRHLLLLLSPNAYTHVTVPQRVEGWVDLAGWLHTEMVYPSTYRRSLLWSRPCVTTKPNRQPYSYSATSNDMKLVHWPLMGGLLHLVQRGGN